MSQQGRTALARLLPFPSSKKRGRGNSLFARSKAKVNPPSSAALTPAPFFEGGVSKRGLAMALSAMLFAALPAAATESVALLPQTIKLDDGRSFKLTLPTNLEVVPVAQGYKRIRFFARSPDGRIFLTDMRDLSDNRKGRVLILDGWDEKKARFARITPYLTDQRNPNNLAFHTDKQGQQWLYLALTDKLVRYRYRAGDLAPSSAPETLATYPDYGLSYKYGGWHLTRTVAFAGNGKMYVSVGSSCNACIEKESVRATVMEYNPDGSGARVYARGLRNAVGLIAHDGRLIATNQGSDHLGLDKPDETFFKLVDGADYGWPHCYHSRGKVYADPKFPRASGCAKVPPAFGWFPAHASALGVDWFPAGDAILSSQYVVALHGSTNAKIGHGYKLVRVNADGSDGGDLITGFLDGAKVNGRPCGVLRMGRDAFLFTDDKYGVIYYVRPKR